MSLASFFFKLVTRYVKAPTNVFYFEKQRRLSDMRDREEHGEGLSFTWMHVTMDVYNMEKITASLLLTVTVFHILGKTGYM